MKYTKIVLPCRIKSKVLALGAQSKAGFCFVKGNTAYLSESSGDLSDMGNFEEFKKQVKIFKKKIKIEPEVIACDLHPEYISSKYAHDLVKGAPRLRSGREGWRVENVQHHEAHVASCIADNNLKGSVIGVAFDGTGFGADGNIWGGEFFIGDVKGFKRVAYLKYVPMPGGEAAVKEPWRMAFSYLYKIYGDNLGLLCRPPRRTPRNDMLRQMVDKRINSPLTSSMGRLFDGVSSLIGICDFASYEGEAAVKLEKIIEGQGSRVKGEYKFKYTKENGMIIIDWEPVIKGVAKDLEQGIKKPEISLKFHNAVCDMIKDVCSILRKKYKIKRVCMSGGVFQNKYLLRHAEPMLEKAGLDVYTHKIVPTHDGGIAIGQAVLAGV